MGLKAEKRTLPTADQWVSSPLRNRLKIRLDADTSAVWDLVGDPTNMPRFSEGLRKVETTLDDRGNCVGYTCFFTPGEGETVGIEHFSVVKWHEKGKGWASVDADSNPFGTVQSLSLMTLEPGNGSTIFTWQFHFNCDQEDLLELNKGSYSTALEDISQRLIKHFGGVALENYVEGP